mmetsp:Transcript_13154/g.20407  ORF Transcript_13154/g.20407 Transcript_13154/m.20407 type:complete len:1351 (-) Transcript_13154:73-4125(-)
MSQQKDSHAITGSSNQNLQGMQHQQSSDEANNSSLIYDRTMKVAKAEYADHGSHGVAAVQMPNDMGMYGNMGGGGLQSSVQMQNQMQQQMQMTALQHQMQMQQQMQQQQQQMQQQHQHQQQQQQQLPSNYHQPNQLNSSQLMQLMMLQQQNQMLQQTLQAQAQQNGQQQNQMMPPPNAMAGQGYPSLVPGTVGSQQLLQALANNPNAFVGNNGIGMGGGPGMSVASANVINTTSNGLIDALNSQLSAAQQPTNMVSESSLSQLVDANGNAVAGALPNQIGMNAAAMNDNLLMFAPGEIINGKKRVSPTVPLHPSQLVNGGGGYNGALSSSLGGKMNSVLEEEDELSNEDKKPRPAKVAQNQAAEKGLMSAALEMGNSHSQQTEQNTGDIPAPAAPQDSKEGKERGPVLTNPSKPAANGGLDNVEGNLLVHKGDIFHIPRKSMHSHPPAPNSSSDETKGKGNDDGEIVEYEVMSLLGQGTFAQVFHCVETKTGQNVAVKIVKNKPAYTRQAAVEIDVFRKLSTIGIGSSEKDDGDASAMSSTLDSNTMSNSKDLSYSGSMSTADGTAFSGGNGDAIIRLMYYFMHQSHLCLVFEMLGSNLYELLKKRQFRGLPLGVVKTLLRQAIDGIKLLGKKNVVHCDLKPENMLMVRNDAIDELIAKSSSLNEIGEAKNEADGEEADPAAAEEEQWIKLIDFGSACFEGQTTHTYIQSRFYRSPEVLVGLPYDSAIDMWSLGCVAAELFLGLPILPGVHEHDQVGRILEMIGNLPGWMLEQGSKSKKFFKSSTSRSSSNTSSDLDVSMKEGTPHRTKWEFRTRQEYINYLSEEEKQSKGGAHKLEQQPTSRYFKKKKLEDIVMHHGSGKTKKEKEELGLFVHFLKGLLDPDPWKRYTAFQASMHPFLSGSKSYRSKIEVGKDGMKTTPKPYDITWVQPWDPSIPRRKLMVVQKKGSRRSSIPTQQSVPEAAAAENPYLLPARTLDIYGTPMRNSLKLEPQSPAMSITSQMAAMADAMSLGRQPSSLGQNSPPPSLFNGMQGFPHSASFGNAAGVGIPMSYNQLASSYQQLAGSYQNFAGRRLSDNFVNAASQQQPQLHDGNESFFIPMPHVPPPPQAMGAQSFSGAYYNGAPSYHPNLESELGYALQRPGVVPGGNDFLLSALRRQHSNSSVGSLNNLPSPTRNYGNYVAPGGMNYPGNNLLHTLGLQEQIADMNSQYNGGGGGGIGGAATSLLAQQLEDYSDTSQQQGGMAAQAASQDAPQLQRQLSNSSMHGSYVGQGNPMSLGNSLPYFQSASFSDYGSAPQGQQIPAHHLNAIVNANLMAHAQAQAQAQAAGQHQTNSNRPDQYEGLKKNSTTE